MITACVCVVCFLCPVPSVYADDLNSLESESSGLRNSLDSINGELLDIGTKIAENEVEIDAIRNDITKTEEQLAIARNNEENYYADMKMRIQYIYENSGESLLGLILSARSLPEFVNKVYFVQSLNEYDRNMFNELQDLRRTIQDEEEYLKGQQEACLNLEKELNAKREELNTKAAAASADLVTLEAKIQELKTQQQQARTVAASTAGNSTKPSGSNGGNTADPSAGTPDDTQGNTPDDTQTEPPADPSEETSGGGYIYPSGDGVLTPEKGVNYYNGYRETYYSQRVLPGNGLNIPGRHVGPDGTIRDENNYLCLASSDHPKGTILQTSLGAGIVYDTGCASGTIDIYTDW